MMSLGQLTKRKRSLLIISLIIVIGGLGLILYNRFTGGQKIPTGSIKATSTSGLNGAASFTQKVYTADLALWDQGDRSFIDSHRAWFTPSFLGGTIDRNPSKTSAAATNNEGPFLFCSKPAHKPDQFSATGGTILPAQQTAVVYVTGKYGGKNEISNLPVQLKAVHGMWAINAIGCTAI